MAVCACTAKVDMTQDEIIEMAQKCNLIGMRPYLDGIYTETLTEFAKLVAAKAIAELESQEPVAWPCVISETDFEQNTITLEMQCSDYKVSAGKHWLTTHPPQRTWVGLTDDEFNELYDRYVPITCYALLIEKVEAKLKDKNCAG